jgi:hypothetical protein
VRDVSFDIETGDLPRGIQEQRCKPFIDTPFVDVPYKEFSPGNAKKPETVAIKRAEWEAEKVAWDSSIEERRASHIASQDDRRKAYYDEKLAKARLKAHQSQILCVSFYDGITGECLWNDGNEQTLILRALDRINNALRYDHAVVGANVIGFDVPYLYRRALLHGLPIGRLVGVGYNGRYEIHRNVVDVLKVYQGPEWGSIPPLGLDALANCFGISGKTETAGGANFQELAEHDRQRAERYAIGDSRVAWDIAEAMGIVSRPQAETTGDLPF